MLNLLLNTLSTSKISWKPFDKNNAGACSHFVHNVDEKSSNVMKSDEVEN